MAKTIHHVGPPGAIKGDGTVGNPFSGLLQALHSGVVKGGDELWLAPGNYGDVRIQNLAFSPGIFIVGTLRGKALFQRIEVHGRSSGMTFKDLGYLWGKPVPGPTMFTTSWETLNIEVVDCIFRSQLDSARCRYWDASRWNNVVASGIHMQGRGHRVRRNRMTGIGFGITLNGDDMLAEGNIINGLNGDALRGLGDQLVFRRNTATNFFVTNGNHMDGFQSFNLRQDKRPFDAMVIENNIIRECTYQTRLPLTAALQGIGMFDGMFSDLRIVNNFVECSAYHGITVAGVVGGVVAHNTVKQAPGGPHVPWLMVGNHKDGRPSSGVFIENNAVASKISAVPSCIQQGNVIGSDVLPNGLPGPSLVGAAVTTPDTPPRDLRGRLRPDPASVGAYELA